MPQHPVPGRQDQIVNPEHPRTNLSTTGPSTAPSDHRTDWLKNRPERLIITLLRDLSSYAGAVPRVVVDVMLKPEILDPQGQAILAALPKLGFDGVTSVRQGKRFELELSPDTGEPAERAKEIAATLLANPVIEDFAIRDGG